MRKIILILLVFCSLVLDLRAQDMRTVFMEAPDSVLPLLPCNARADCIDFADAGMIYPVTNILDGKSVLKELGDDYLLLQSTGSSTVEMKLLPYDGRFVICVVNTVFAEVADSRISFFDSGWNRIEKGTIFTAPSIEDFFIGDDSRVLDKCDIYLVSLKLDSADNLLTAEYTMPGYMNSEDAAEVRSSMRKVVYRWNGKKFVME